MNAALPRMLTLADLLEILGGEEAISRRQIQRLAKRGEIPGAVMLGTKVYFQREAVFAWVEGKPIPPKRGGP